ncbi:hypothetical protein OXX80_005411 [Metschnikowia pulcherrima]
MKSAILLRKSKSAVILVVLGVLAYIDYASCYVIAWKEVYRRHSTAAAIVFWVLLAMGPPSYPTFSFATSRDSHFGALSAKT